MPNESMMVAAIQMNSADDIDANFRAASELAKQAVDEGARLLVFPENFLCFGVAHLPELNQRLDELLIKLEATAKELGAAIIAGSLPFSCEQDETRYYTSCVAINASGRQLEHYNKMHLFDVDVDDSVGAYRESDTYLRGEKPVTVELEGLKVGLSICYDLRFPMLYQYYLQQQVDVIVVPSAFTSITGSAHWSSLLRARAIETQSFVVAPNQCGIHGKSRETWGHSMIVDPWGEVLAECGAAPGYCLATLDTSRLARLRASMPIRDHRRLIQ